jgi:hypothetical protein
LKRAGVRDVVLPEADLTDGAIDDTQLGSAHFTSGGVGGVTALSTDGPLSTLFADTAHQRWSTRGAHAGHVGVLAFRSTERTAARTVVIVAPIAETSVAFLKDVLNGFASNPFVTLATLTPSFQTSLVATNGAPAHVRRAPRTTVRRGRRTTSPHSVTSSLT